MNLEKIGNLSHKEKVIYAIGIKDLELILELFPASLANSLSMLRADEVNSALELLFSYADIDFSKVVFQRNRQDILNLIYKVLIEIGEIQMKTRQSDPNYELLKALKDQLQVVELNLDDKSHSF